MFLRKIFGKKPETTELRVEKLSIGSLKERILRIRQERFAVTRSKLNDILDKLSGERGALLNGLKALSEAEPSENISPVLYKSALEARRLLVDKLTRSLVGFQPLKEISTDVLTSLDGKLTKMVNLTTNAITIHGRYVRMLFGPHLNPLQLHLRQLHELVRESRALIKDVLEKTRSLDALLSKVESQMEFLRQIDALQSESKLLTEQAAQLEKFIESENTKLAQFMESEEFKRTGPLREEIQRIEQEITYVKNAVTGALSSISRPLRKMEKLVTSGKYEMDRELRITLKLCTRDPLAVISSDEKVSATQLMLQRMLGLLEEGKINLSERERMKRAEMVRGIVRDEKLTKFKKRLEQLQKERENRLRAWEQLPHLRKSELEQSIEKYRSDLKSMQTRIKEVDGKLEAARQEINKNRAELERLASEVMNVQIKLTS